MPLVVMLAGAGQGPEFSVNLLSSLAASKGFLILAIGKRGVTWDALTYKFSYDVTFINNAIKWAFDRVAVNPARIVLAGFSDGATYGLGLGLANGDLFKYIIAFSPGYVVGSDSPDVGKPKFFFSHGIQDNVLHIDSRSGGRLVSRVTPGCRLDFTRRCLRRPSSADNFPRNLRPAGG